MRRYADDKLTIHLLYLIGEAYENPQEWVEIRPRIYAIPVCIGRSRGRTGLHYAIKADGSAFVVGGNIIRSKSPTLSILLRNMVGFIKANKSKETP